MHIGAFHNAQVVSFIPSEVIGCETSSGYATVHICWPAHWHFCLFGDAGRASESVSIVYYFLLCVRAVDSLIDFDFPANRRRKNLSKRKERQVLSSYQRTVKAVEHAGDGNINCNWCAWDSSQRIGKETRSVTNRKTNRYHPNCGILRLVRILRGVLEI